MMFETERVCKHLDIDTYRPLCSISIYREKKHENHIIYYKVERVFILIAISAKEKQIIAETFPMVHIRRTVKQKSNRHRYYMEESRDAMRVLRSLRRSS